MRDVATRIRAFVTLAETGDVHAALAAAKDAAGPAVTTACVGVARVPADTSAALTAISLGTSRPSTDSTSRPCSHRYCPHLARPNRKQCTEHAAKAAAHSAKRYAERKQRKDLCLHCDSPPETGAAMCRKHLDYALEHAKQWREKRLRTEEQRKAYNDRSVQRRRDKRIAERQAMGLPPARRGRPPKCERWLSTLPESEREFRRESLLTLLPTSGCDPRPPLWVLALRSRGQLIVHRGGQWEIFEDKTP